MCFCKQSKAKFNSDEQNHSSSGDWYQTSIRQRFPTLTFIITITHPKLSFRKCPICTVYLSADKTITQVPQKSLFLRSVRNYMFKECISQTGVTYTLLKCLKHLFNHSGLENAKDIWSRILPSLILVDLEMYYMKCFSLRSTAS